MNSAIEGDVEEAPDEFAGPDESAIGQDYSGRCRKDRPSTSQLCSCCEMFQL